MSSFALFTELSMVFVKQNFHILCLCWAPDLRLGDDWTRLMCFTWRHHHHGSHFLASWHVVGLSACGQALPPRSGSQRAERPPEVVRQEGAEQSLGVVVVIFSGNLHCTVLSLSLTTNWTAAVRTQLNSNFPEKGCLGFSHLLVTFLSVFISRHCQNIQKHSDALTFLHYLLWGQWGSS